MSALVLLAATISNANGDQPEAHWEGAPCETTMDIPAELMSQNPKFILVGEIHGTDTSPEAFGDMVCAQAKQRAVLVQFELPSEWGSWIDQYVQTGDDKFLRKLLASPLFTAAFYDGRASVDFIRLISRLRAIAADGLQVSVTGFQPDWQTIEPQHYYELSMAHALAKNAAAYPEAINMILVGNYHVRRLTAEDAGQSAASFLRSEDFIALSPCPEGGTASVRADGENSTRKLADYQTGKPRGVYAIQHFKYPRLAQMHSYDGLFCAGRPSQASPRAVPLAER